MDFFLRLASVLFEFILVYFFGQIMSNVIITDLLSELRTTIGSLYKLSEIVSVLDMIVSLADVSSLSGFVK